MTSASVASATSFGDRRERGPPSQKSSAEKIPAFLEARKSAQLGSGLLITDTGGSDKRPATVPLPVSVSTETPAEEGEQENQVQAVTAKGDAASAVHDAVEKKEQTIAESEASLRCESAGTN